MNTRLQNAKNLYLEGIRDGNYREAIHKYTGHRYTQHSTGVKDGKEGFIEFFEDFVQRCPVRDIEIVRGCVEGDFGFLHALQNINNGEQYWVTTDFFLFDENDKILEHWDVISEYCPQTPSGHTSTDGPTEVTDLNQTEANKQVVRGLIEQVLMAGGDPTRMAEFIDTNQYIQHNAAVQDGYEAFYQLATQPNPPLRYHEVVLCVGQGNFVATLSKASWEGKPYAQVDVFRLHNGKIVEHWDNAKPVPENPVNSGKF